MNIIVGCSPSWLTKIKHAIRTQKVFGDDTVLISMNTVFKLQPADGWLSLNTETRKPGSV